MTTKAELLKMVRLNCGECMGGPRASEWKLPIPNPGDVAGCTAPACIWFEYRFGKDPAPNKARQAIGQKMAVSRSPDYSEKG